MFKEARIKLTTWYLLIIMIVSLSFSGVIYVGINRELRRIEDFQRIRIQRIIGDVDAIAEARARIIFTLGFINLSILFFSGLGGYILAGLTLDPISEMMEEQKEFVSNASHELRTPLTSLMTEIEVALRDKKLSLTDAKKLLRSNLEDVNRMANLSNYLLKLNKHQHDSTNLEFKRVDLATVVIKAVGKEKIETDLEKTIVLGDIDSLVELTSILIDNAKKYSDSNKIKVTTRNKTMTVSDNGIGISEKDLPHIFDRFFRGNKSRNKDGYGLGLAIAKSIADLHNATIKVTSKPDKGSIFTVTF